MTDVRSRLETALLATDDRAADRLVAMVRHDRDLATALPEVAAIDLGTGGGRHKDLLDHTARVVAKVPARLPLRMAALLHDVGKPDTRRLDGPEVTFTDHEGVGARIARDVLGRLGYGAGFVDHVATVVEMSGRFKQSGAFSDSAVRRYASDAGDALEDLLVLCALDVTSRHRHKHDAQATQVAALRDRIAAVRAADARSAERPDLDGRQVMDLLGLEPGEQVGAALAVLMQARRQRGPLTHDEAVDVLEDWWAGRTA